MEFQDQVQAQNQAQNTSPVQTIPLENVNIIGYMLDNMGKINYEMTFSNSTKETINPIYYFSLEPKATICKFTMLVGTQVLMGEVQEKSQAQKTYNEAQTEGKKTALIEKISDSDYKVSVGNVEPGLRVIVSFDYLIVLELDDDYGFKFNVPTNIGLKYFSTPLTQGDWEYKCEYSKMKWIDKTTDNISYSFDFELRWLSSNYFKEFKTNIDLISIELSECLIFRGNKIPLDGDINLIVKTESKPTGYIYEDEDIQKAYIISNIKIPGEIIKSDFGSRKNYQFILDRSGSMGGIRLKNAIKALEMFIQELPQEAYFNVISFGTCHSAIWSNSVPAHDFFKQACLADIKSYNADMGGTEIYSCFHDMFNLLSTSAESLFRYKLEAKKTCPSNYENIIVVLTDGDVGSIDNIFKMVCEQQTQSETNTRIFTFGLGSQASKQFVKGLSDLTFGDYAMIGDSEDLLEPVKKIISTVNKQYYTGVELESKSKNIDITSNKINSVYPGKIYSIICEVGLNKVEELKSSGLRLEAYNPIKAKPIEWDISLDAIGDEYFDYSIIKQLYWNEQIRQMEKSIQFDKLDRTQIDSLQKQIVKISVENSIMNQYTSFVLVDKSGEFDVEQIGKDLVVPNLSSSTTGCISKSMPISSILGSCKNASYDIRGGGLNPSTLVSPFTKSNDDDSIGYSAPMAYSAPSSNIRYEEVDCLEGGMDMFGGGGGHWVLKYKIFINWYDIDKLKNKTNGSYKFEADGWKHLCYISQTDFDAHCTQVNMVRVLFFNFIILLELEKNHSPQDYKQLMEYFELKHPGLYNSKKAIVSKMYNDYIDNLRTQKVWVNDGGDY